MKIIAKIIMAFFLTIQGDTIPATSWGLVTIEEAIQRSDIIAVFSGVEVYNYNDEKNIYTFDVKSVDISIKGSTNNNLKFCSSYNQDFSDNINIYLLFLRRISDLNIRSKGYEECDYMLESAEQNAYPVIDYVAEKQSGLILIYRISPLDGNISDSYTLNASHNRLFLTVDLEDALDIIKLNLHKISSRSDNYGSK